MEARMEWRKWNSHIAIILKAVHRCKAKSESPASSYFPGDIAKVLMSILIIGWSMAVHTGHTGSRGSSGEG